MTDICTIDFENVEAGPSFPACRPIRPSHAAGAGEDKIMSMLSRRGAIGGAVAVATSAAVAPLHAAAPPIGNQAPGFYRYRVGDIEITVVNDGVSRMPIQVNAVQHSAFATCLGTPVHHVPGLNSLRRRGCSAGGQDHALNIAA